MTIGDIVTTMLARAHDLRDMGREYSARHLETAAQELMPRVLTLSELAKLPDGKENCVPVCIEERVPLGTWDGGSLLKWVGADFAKEMYLTDNVYYNPRTYNRTWRAWTQWPMALRREATPWKE